MTYIPPKSSVFDLPDEKKAALISLLTDEDPEIFKTIRDEIMSHGSGVRTWLAPYALDEDPLLRRRTKEIVTYFDRSDSDTLFHAFCNCDFLSTIIIPRLPEESIAFTIKG